MPAGGLPPGVSAEAFLAFGRQILASQPFSGLLGAELTHLALGEVTIELPIRDELKQQNGFAHGGVVSYLADNALTYAGGTAMQVPVLTSEFKVNYVRPALGERLIARARAEATGQAQSVCRCEVYAVSGGVEKLCALAQGTIARIPPNPPAKAPGEQGG